MHTHTDTPADDALSAVDSLIPSDIPAAVRDLILSAVEAYGDIRSDITAGELTAGE